MLKRVSIRAYIHKLSQKIEEKALVRGEWSLAKATIELKGILETTSQEIKENGFTMPIVKARHKAIAMLNKIHGIGRPKYPVDAPKVMFESSINDF